MPRANGSGGPRHRLAKNREWRASQPLVIRANYNFFLTIVKFKIKRKPRILAGIPGARVSLRVTAKSNAPSDAHKSASDCVKPFGLQPL